MEAAEGKGVVGERIKSRRAQPLAKVGQIRRALGTGQIRGKGSGQVQTNAQDALGMQPLAQGHRHLGQGLTQVRQSLHRQHVGAVTQTHAAAGMVGVGPGHRKGFASAPK